jgi:hypothetical protein
MKEVFVVREYWFNFNTNKFEEWTTHYTDEKSIADAKVQHIMDHFQTSHLGEWEENEVMKQWGWYKAFDFIRNQDGNAHYRVCVRCETLMK